MTAAALLAGLAADALLGDPRRGHPVAIFGAVAERVERATWCPTRRRGALACGGLVGGVALAVEGAARAAQGRRRHGRAAVLLVTTWAALGGRSLGAVATRIAARLRAGDLAAARAGLPALVGRDASELDAGDVARAVVESVAENTSDAVVGAVFWGAIAGPAGVAGFRAANTLDAMWGHRNDRYGAYGTAAARLDDVLGWIPARLTVACCAAAAPLVGGSPGAVLRAARRDGVAHPSPNAGPVEAAFAGALGVRLGGPQTYAGRYEARPALGRSGRPPVAADIPRAVALSRAIAVLATLLCAAAARRTPPAAPNADASAPWRTWIRVRSGRGR